MRPGTPPMRTPRLTPGKRPPSGLIGASGFLDRHFPSTDLRRHTATFTVYDTDGKRLAGLQVGKAGPAQHFDMHENVLVPTEGIGKTESLALVEPFHARRLQRGRPDDFWIDFIQIGQSGAVDVIRRFDLQNLDRLHAAVRALHFEHDTGTIRDRALAKVPQNVGMQEYVRAAFISDHEAEPLHRIKPFHAAMHAPRFAFCIRHFIPPTSLCTPSRLRILYCFATGFKGKIHLYSVRCISRYVKFKG